MKFNLKSIFNELNEKYFNGSLPPIEVSFKKFLGAQAYFVEPDRKTKTREKIQLNKRIDWNKKLVYNILCHEMIHYYCFLLDGDKSSGKNFHEGMWKEKANEISSSKSWKYGKILAQRNIYGGKKYREPFWVCYSNENGIISACKVSENCVNKYKNTKEYTFVKTYIPSLSLDYPKTKPAAEFELTKKESLKVLNESGKNGQSCIYVRRENS